MIFRIIALIQGLNNAVTASKILKKHCHKQKNMLLNANNDNHQVLYAFECKEMDTWFFTSSKKTFMPKGSILKLKALATKTNEPVYTQSNIPTVNDIIADIESQNWKIIKFI